MKYPLAVSIVLCVSSSALVACSGSQKPPKAPPPSEPVSTTTVTSSALTIETPSTSPAPEVEADPVRDPETDADRALDEKIRQHLAKKPELNGVGWSRVRIVTADGNVTLAGELPTTADAIEVEHAVREVKGVKGVTNDIHLPRGSEEEDSR